MRNRNLLRALLYLGVLVKFDAAPGMAESHQAINVSMRPYEGARSVVALKVNGAGPYDFMVDTEATLGDGPIRAASGHCPTRQASVGARQGTQAKSTNRA